MIQPPRNFTRRSSLSDGYYVSMPDNRLTFPRLVAGVFVLISWVACCIFLSGWF